jgi:hypothetical protein
MNKDQIRILLCKTFTASAVDAWLKQFSDNQVFAPQRAIDAFIDYINELPSINKHEDE